MNKPIVQFSRKAGVVILSSFVNDTALLTPIDHPDSVNVSNKKQVITSRILRKEVTCCRIIALETENTIYMEYDDGEYLG